MDDLVLDALRNMSWENWGPSMDEVNDPSIKTYEVRVDEGYYVYKRLKGCSHGSSSPANAQKTEFHQSSMEKKAPHPITVTTGFDLSPLLVSLLSGRHLNSTVNKLTKTVASYNKANPIVIMEDGKSRIPKRTIAHYERNMVKTLLVENDKLRSLKENMDDIWIDTLKKHRKELLELLRKIIERLNMTELGDELHDKLSEFEASILHNIENIEEKLHNDEETIDIIRADNSMLMETIRKAFRDELNAMTISSLGDQDVKEQFDKDYMESDEIQVNIYEDRDYSDSETLGDVSDAETLVDSDVSNNSETQDEPDDWEGFSHLLNVSRFL